MRVKVDWRTGGKHAYENFVLKNPDVKIDYDTWRKIIYTFNEMLRDHILNTGDLIRIPSALGALTICRRRKKAIVNKDGKTYIRLPIDWKKTKEKGKIVYHMNFHTDGYHYCWRWLKSHSFIKNKDFWYYRPSRKSSRLIKEYILKNPEFKYIYKPREYVK